MFLKKYTGAMVLLVSPCVAVCRVRHLGVLLGYLEQVLRKLLENKIASARQTIRLAAKVHWDRKMLGVLGAGLGALGAGRWWSPPSCVKVVESMMVDDGR